VETAGARAAPPAVVTLPTDIAIEGDLLAEGYQTELKQAVIEYQKPFHSEQHEHAKSAEVIAWPDDELQHFLKGNKTGMASHWATAILALQGDRAIPASIRDLFQRIEQTLSPNPPETNP